jgi:hypothetical protein
LAAVVLKFVPVMVTDEPIAPEVGEKEVIVGTVVVDPVVAKLDVDEYALVPPEFFAFTRQ